MAGHVHGTSGRRTEGLSQHKVPSSTEHSPRTSSPASMIPPCDPRSDLLPAPTHNETTAPSAAQVPTLTTCPSAAAQRKPHPARGSAQRAACAAPQSPRCAAPSRPAPNGPFCKYTLLFPTPPKYHSRGTRAGRSRSPHPARSRPAPLTPAEALPRPCAAPPAPCEADGVGAAPPALPAAGLGCAEPFRAVPCRAGWPTRGKTERGGCAGVARSLRGEALSLRLCALAARDGGAAAPG